MGLDPSDSDDYAEDAADTVGTELDAAEADTVGAVAA